MSRPKLKKKRKSKLAEGTFRTSEDLVGQDLGPCPFCGGKVGAVNNKGKQAVYHSLPICPKFETEDPLMFIHNMRMKTVGPLPDDEEWPMPVKQEPS